MFDPIRRSVEPTRSSLGSATCGILTASLYRFATKGDLGPMFHAETLSRAFGRSPMAHPVSDKFADR